MNLYHKVKRIPMHTLYAIAELIAFVLHFIYVIFAYLRDDQFFVSYNILITIFYLCLAYVAQQKKLMKFCAIMSFVEINIFISVSQILLGNDCGFGYVLFGIFILQFHLLHLATNEIKFTMKFSMISMVFFLLSNIISSMNCIDKIPMSIKFGNIYYYYNMMCGIIAIVISFIFVIYKIVIDNEYLQVKNKELQNAANYDSLTKLLNRRSYDFYMNNFFQSATKNGEDFCVMILDIDNFKHINDTYGHPNGDIVLREVANVINKTIRPYDVAFRWGGEEFLIVAKGGRQSGITIAERCRSAISKLSFEFNNENVNITITAGVCPYKIGATKELLVDKADAALYEGKTSGKNVVICSKNV